MSDNHDTAVRILAPTPAVEVYTYHVASDRLVSGNPLQSIWLEYEDPTKQFSVGIWASEVGEWRIRYTEEEYCRILEGRSVITDEAGRSVTVVAGTEFTIPAGFVGTWRVEEPTRKRFVIHEKPAS